MAISITKKEDLIDGLQTTLGKGQKLEIRLRLTGEGASADEVAKRNRALSKKIDRLIRDAMNEWTGGAAAFEKEIKSSNRRLQAAIRDIKKKIKVAENVVKALGYIDDAIQVAAKIAAVVA